MSEQAGQTQLPSTRLSRLGRWVSWGLLLIAATAAILPLYWMTTGSLKLQSDAMKTPPEWFPENPTVANYEKLFGGQEGGAWSGKRPASRWLVNSLLVAVSISVYAV